MGSKRSSGLDFSDGASALKAHEADFLGTTYDQRNKAERFRLQGLNSVVAPAPRFRPNPTRLMEFGEKISIWLINEGRQRVFFAVFLLLHLLLVIFGLIQYGLDDNFNNARATFGATFAIARTAALILHVDVIFILLPVCRNFISILRRTPLGDVIPFDKNITFHKATGWSIVVGSVVHTLAHIVNLGRLALVARDTTGRRIAFFLSANFTIGPVITGWLMWICLGTIVWFSVEKRRNAAGGYERFCASGLSAAFSGLGSAFLREVRSRHITYISKIIQHPSNVIELQIKKEKTTVRAGQYIFINCPEISYFQWHPFTLTSAPEEDYLSVHIRVVGDFTQALALAVGCDCDGGRTTGTAPSGESKVVDIKANPTVNRVLPRIMIDGPFSTVSKDFLKYETVLLVGAGIGATAFASILKTIWYRMNNFSNGKRTRLSKVYFTWIIRDFNTVEWFHSLLRAVEEQDSQNRIEISIHLTGGIKEDDINNIVVQDVGAEKDAITALRAPTHYGRPNWDRMFSSLGQQHPESDIGVFCCGPKALGYTLRYMSNKHSGARGARFFFGKESF
ncbi:Superoxide-generating NADPH oxidase heavy chain subunit A [Mycena venus]|uniref:Superoxide-generating NADPH oxidase heavy chain subunit A n=1 Tax=Mycena venus TaxID=2733690 RepID=A0A8H6X874_9AGAR|nr:Superoxide-generating NADPH oxidase heavy chain subunit A [Mycena venus]